MRIAIIGSGISGLVCAYILSKQHDVTIFEADDRLGGHTHTVRTPSGELVDTGFIVFNYANYPNFAALLAELGVPAKPTSMSFSSTCEVTGFEYSTASLNRMFAQRKNIFNLTLYSMILGILRFNRDCIKALDNLDDSTTVREFISQHGYNSSFVKYFLYPISTALWSCPQSNIEDFPMKFILEFYRHHGMHKLLNQPGWHVIQGGSFHYIERMTSQWKATVRLSTPIKSVERYEACVVIHADNLKEQFDEVIFACHSDQALQILQDKSTQNERALLTAFPYTRNTVVLHNDTRVLPNNQRAWSAWNSRIEKVPASQAKVTYNMNILQGIHTPETHCVSLNLLDRIDSNKVIRPLQYDHPIYNRRRSEVQKRHGEVIRRNRTSFCGAYWGNGFHEAGVCSALKVCDAFGLLPAWAQRPNWSS